MKRIARILIATTLALVIQNGVWAQRGGREETESAVRAQRQSNNPERNPQEFTGIDSKVEYYESKMDGKKRPYGVSSIGDAKELKPLLVLVQPGLTSNPNPEGMLRSVREFGAIVKKHKKSAVVIRPTGRGPGSRFQNYGEVDTLEAIEDACNKYPIDRDRISVFGHSMGGCATWYLAAHYPDLFASAVPLAGYCDYRLWAKTGGLTYHMNEFEQPSWEARSAPFMVENFEHTAVWIWHGERDRALGGGVPVSHAREMAAKLQAQGFPCKYTEIPDEGHHFITPFKNEEMKDDYILWMLEQKKVRNPKHVALAAYWLRHGKSHWAQIGQFKKSGERGLIDAAISEDGKTVTAETTNVAALALGPIEGASKMALVIDGKKIGSFDLSRKQFFKISESGAWEPGDGDLGGEKRLGVSGPISDLFFNEVIYVGGTTGTDDETYYNTAIANFSEREFRDRNGGLHRGGINGDNTVESLVLKDTEIGPSEIQQNNLILFGTDKTNAVLKDVIGQLPLEFGEGFLKLGGKTFKGDDVAVFAIFPHPDNSERYVAVHGGVSEDAIVYGSHLNLMLLPDYVVYDQGSVLAWGFWDNTWKTLD